MSPKLVFVSNYFNLHQKPLADEFYRLFGKGNYYFVETEPMSASRIALGFEQFREPYLVKMYSSKEERMRAEKLILNAEIVVFGYAPKPMHKRIRQGMMTFRYTERLFKKPCGFLRYMKRWFAFRYMYGKNTYCLCASAYTAEDFARLGLYKGKCYKWGYFTHVDENLPIETVIKNKRKNSILFVGRLINWKHPDLVIRCVKELCDSGIECGLRIAGIGPMRGELEKLVSELGMAAKVTFLGALDSEAVRKEMIQAKIFLFTSDRQEGWGAVLNEAMSCGCAVVASEAAGATPYLIEDGKNGFSFESGDLISLTHKTRLLIEDEELCSIISRSAYFTIRDVWSAKNAARHFLELASSLKEGSRDLSLEGPCSLDRGVRQSAPER